MDEATDTRLTVWTLYENPLDHPGKWIIRGHDILRNGTMLAHDLAYIGKTRAEVENQFTLDQPGLHWLGRAPEDEAQIVGTWV